MCALFTLCYIEKIESACKTQPSLLHVGDSPSLSLAMSTHQASSLHTFEPTYILPHPTNSLTPRLKGKILEMPEQLGR